MKWQKKVHRFADCGADMGKDRSEGSLTDRVQDCTCGTCRARILNVIAQTPWNELTSTLVAELHHVAVKLDKGMK